MLVAVVLAFVSGWVSSILLSRWALQSRFGHHVLRAMDEVAREADHERWGEPPPPREIANHGSDRSSAAAEFAASQSLEKMSSGIFDHDETRMETLERFPPTPEAGTRPILLLSAGAAEDESQEGKNCQSVSGGNDTALASEDGSDDTGRR